MRNNKILSFSIFLGAVVFAFLYFFQAGSASEKETVTKKEVEVKQVERNAIEKKQEFSSTVKGFQETDLAPKISGRLLKVYKKEGDRVYKGEIVALIDGNELLAEKNLAYEKVKSSEKSLDEKSEYYEQLVDEAEESLDQAEEDLDEAKDSGDESESRVANSVVEKAEEAVKSAKELEDLQGQLAKNQLNISKQQLSVASSYADSTKIVAPYSGVITGKYFETGSLVSPASPIVSISKSKEKELDIFVPGKIADQINVGKGVILTSESGDEVSGTVYAISPASDKISRKSKIRISFSGDRFGLGGFVTAHLVIERQENEIVIPLSSIRKDYHENVVFVEEDGVAKKKVVELGTIDGNYAQVISGLKEGENLIVNGHQYLKNNEKIDIK